jgi:hypothetical protein
MLLRLPLVLLAVVLAAACGDPAPLTPIPEPEGSCSAGAFRVSPMNGAGPVHRMTPVIVSWNGAADDVVIALRAGDSAIEGESWLGAQSALFMPSGLLPADAQVQWTVSACGVTKSGAFATGQLLHPMAELDVTHLGKPLAMDLRSATWTSPEPRRFLGDVLLKWRLAPSMLVMLAEVHGDEATFVLAPGVARDENVVADGTRRVQVIRASLRNNPYLALQTADLALAIADGMVTLRDVDLVFGLSDSGFEDGRLTAMMDVRGIVNGPDPCAVLQTLTGERCRPCEAKDEEAGCFLVEMRDVVALPTKSAIPTLDRGPPPVVPGLDGPGRLDIAPAPETAPEVKPTIPCVTPRCDDARPPPPTPPPAR